MGQLITGIHHITALAAETQENLDFYKIERKTHPSFLRGWDISD